MEILKSKIKFSLQKAFILSGLLSFVVTTSCEKDAKIKLPKIEPELVIQSFISPQDTIIRVDLTLSEPLYYNSNKNKYQPVENALVTISSDLGTGILTYDSILQFYKIDSALLKIREGIDYKILVTTPDGKSANATTRIPQANTTISLSLTADSTLKISWTDPTETVDYYRLFFQSSAYYLFQGNDSIPLYSDTIYSRYVDAEWYPDTQAENGMIAKISEYYNLYYRPDNMYVYLLHVSKEYYDYGIRLQIAINANDNPFSEAVPMYSNVQGGFGIFAGYNSIKKKAP